jgi:CRP-like cAMP-binding protein
VLGSLDKAIALRAAPLFASMHADELLPVATLCADVTLDGGDVLFEQGDLGDAMYVVIRGKVLIERDGEVIAELGPGETVGEMAVIDWEPRSASVIAHEPTQLIRLDRHDLLDLLVQSPTLATRMTAVLIDRVRTMSG